MEKQTVGFIGGGQMAEALIRGVSIAGIVEPGEMMVIDPDPKRLAYLEQEYHVQTTTSPEQLSLHSGTIIIAVKPQVANSVLATYSQYLTNDHLVISIMAGVELNQLEMQIGFPARIIRVMPNTPALVLEGASAFSSNSHATEADRDTCHAIFAAVGTCVEVGESMLDAVTGLSGSGPGYIFTLIDALIDGGVLVGLPRPIAEELVIQTLYGSAKLAKQSSENPAALKAQVTSPGGTTIHGIEVLEDKGVRAALMSAVKAGTERSRELGQ